MGYAGGHTTNPTYHNLADHTETLQLDFDPAQITYRELLRLFWVEHRPVHKPWSRQYMSAVFCDNAAQFEIAEQVKAEFEARWDATVYTEVRIEPHFYRAEDYHQKYRLQRYEPIMHDLSRYYPRFDDLVDSPTATRLNAYFGGAVAKAKLVREIESFGLSQQSVAILNKKVR